MPVCSTCGWLEETNTILSDGTTLCEECFVCRKCRRGLWGRAWWTDWGTGWSYCVGCARWRLSREQGVRGTEVMLEDVGGGEGGLEVIVEEGR